MDRSAHFYPTDMDLTVTEAVYSSCIKRPQDFVFVKTNPRYSTLALILSGSAEYDLGDRQFSVVAGDVLFIPERISYTVTATSEEPWEAIAVGFCTAESLKNLPLSHVEKAAHGSRLEDLFQQIHKAWIQCAFGYRIHMKNLVGQILHELLQESFNRHFESNVALSSLRIAADYMEKNYREHITVEALAELSGYSASHFSRQFSKVYGTSPIQYLNEIRILHAKNLLCTDQYSMAEIAQKCGFSNIYYFSRCFKQLTGSTPGKW